MGLVQRVGHNVQKRQREKGQPALKHHEAHLCNGRPGQRGLDRRLGQHDETAEDRGKPADRHQCGQNTRSRGHDIGKTDQ